METTPPPAFPVEGPSGRVFRRWGLLLLLLASMLPYHGCRVHPGEFAVPKTSAEGYDPANTGYNGAAFLEGVLRSTLLGESGFRVEDAIFPCDGKSDDFVGPFVFLALPVWIAALFLVRGNRPRTRWTLGTILWLAVGALFLWAALASDWTVDLSKGPPAFGMTGPLLLLPVAGGLLLLRPRRRWRIPDVEATVSSHAVLALGLCLAVPSIQGWTWMAQDGHSFAAVLRALGSNYRSGFWAALAALALIAAPLYFSEGALGRLLDRFRRTPPPSPDSAPSSP